MAVAEAPPPSQLVPLARGSRHAADLSDSARWAALGLRAPASALRIVPVLAPQGAYLLRWWSPDERVIGERPVTLHTWRCEIDLPLA